MARRETKILHPGEEDTIGLDVSAEFQIKPEQGYGALVRRSNGLPYGDQTGNEIAAELSRSGAIPGNEDR
jgi:hypothetical protein